MFLSLNSYNNNHPSILIVGGWRGERGMMMLSNQPQSQTQHWCLVGIFPKWEGARSPQQKKKVTCDVATLKHTQTPSPAHNCQKSQIDKHDALRQTWTEFGAHLVIESHPPQNSTTFHWQFLGPRTTLSNERRFLFLTAPHTSWRWAIRTPGTWCGVGVVDAVLRNPSKLC